MQPNHQSPTTKTTDIDMIPVEYDASGNVRRYEIVRREQPQIEPPQVIDMAPIVSPLPVQPARLTTITEGSHQDRARAFSISTWQLSIVTGALFVVAAIALSGATIPILSLALTFFGGFALTWLAAYILHTLSSAEGVELYGTWRLWNFLDREQAERHRRYGNEPQRHISTGDKLLIAGVAIYILAMIISWLSVR